MPIRTLFVDIGGVLLTNGWDRDARQRACEQFGLDYEEFSQLHSETFSTYEEGDISLDTYLNRVVFTERRPFSREEFREFMFAQSRALTDMIELVSGLKGRYRLKTIAVSNEGRELTIHRVDTFGLRTVIDFFVCSCFVHHRKPDAHIYEIAIDCAQVPPGEALYIDDRKMFTDVAAEIGLAGIHHVSHGSTRAELETRGLVL